MKQVFINHNFQRKEYVQKKQFKGFYVLQVEVIHQNPHGCKKIYYGSFFCTNSLGGGDMANEILKQFNNFLLLDKGLKEITRNGHLRSISVILKKIEYPTKENFREYIIGMHEEDYSNSHIINTIKSIEYFTEFKGTPITFAKMRRPRRLIEDYLTEAEISCMIRVAKNIRETAMIVFLAFSGVRNKEFCNVKVKDIDFGNNQAIIRQGKFSRDRIVNLGYKAINVLVQYLTEYKKDKEDYLFTTIKKNNKYKTSDLRKLAQTISKRANIGRRVFPHIFRHSLATNLILRGANILLVKEQLGHTDIQTTMNYIQRLPIQVIKTQYDYHAPSYI